MHSPAECGIHRTDDRGIDVVAIRTERLVLREYTPDDWRAVAASQSDPRYLRYYPWAEREASTVRHWIEGLIARQSESPRDVFQLAITVARRGRSANRVAVEFASTTAPAARATLATS